MTLWKLKERNLRLAGSLGKLNLRKIRRLQDSERRLKDRKERKRRLKDKQNWMLCSKVSRLNKKLENHQQEAERQTELDALRTEQLMMLHQLQEHCYALSNLIEILHLIYRAHFLLIFHFVFHFIRF